MATYTSNHQARRPLDGTTLPIHTRFAWVRVRCAVVTCRASHEQSKVIPPPPPPDDIHGADARDAAYLVQAGGRALVQHLVRGAVDSLRVRRHEVLGEAAVRPQLPEGQGHTEVGACWSTTVDDDIKTNSFVAEICVTVNYYYCSCGEILSTRVWTVSIVRSTYIVAKSITTERLKHFPVNAVVGLHARVRKRLF